jgi:pimeloyl-ACP methyl ester carboxylesterase
VKIIVTFAIIIFFLLSLGSCLSFRKSDNQMLKKAKQYAKEISIEYYKFNGVTMRNIQCQNINKISPLLVLIHGAPGSSSAFFDYLKDTVLTNNYSIIIIDRLGYGFSDYGRYSSILNQSEVIISLLDSLKRKNQDVFILGHSYGGTISAVIASLRPEFLTASVLMAPALDPENEKYFWFGKLGKWKATRWMASGALKVATDEKYNHASELKLLQNNWLNINSPVLHIHGNKDNVVPIVNLDYSQSVFPKEYLTVYNWEGMNHFFPFSSKEKSIFLMHNFFNKHKRYSN